MGLVSDHNATYYSVMVVSSTHQVTGPPNPGDAEALFKEARQRERRRRITVVWALVLLLAVLSLGLYALLASIIRAASEHAVRASA